MNAHGRACDVKSSEEQRHKKHRAEDNITGPQWINVSESNGNNVSTVSPGGPGSPYRSFKLCRAGPSGDGDEHEEKEAEARGSDHHQLGWRMGEHFPLVDYCVHVLEKERNVVPEGERWEEREEREEREE
ncbi:hypothetical protein EYF80_054014 [Liparis tanakae]|uniref:Uncharacterized protein n=1 Tax=Liparis tanakae TaxID=230148 RepID=A0A4Z2F3T7_9TELE|nr:hypothetical protein EYF80_054014 [Liparis tanakae]